MAKDDVVKRVRERDPACAKVGRVRHRRHLPRQISERPTSSPRRSARASASATSCSAGIPATSSTTTSSFTGWHTAYPDAEVAAAARDRAGDAVRGRDAALPRRVRRRAPRRSARAACCAGCWRARPTLGFARQGGGGIRILRLRGNAAFGARQGLSRPEADHARAISAIRCCAPASIPISTTSSGRPATRCASRSRGCTPRPGPGVIEAAIRVDDALEAADKAALFKTVAKILAQRRGWMATFMAKWSNDWPGQSGHLHMSLRRCEDRQGSVLRRGQAARHVATRCAGSSAASRR